MFVYKALAKARKENCKFITLLPKKTKIQEGNRNRNINKDTS